MNWADFFPSRTVTLYMGKMFLLRTFAILAALVLILQTLDLLGESGKILAVPGNGDAEVWRYISLRVPQGEFVPGPEQADTIIDTDSQVNQQIALWIRHGSEVIRGHTIVLPVKGDLIYIEPLWISSIQNHLPEVKMFSVVYRGRCVMATSLKKAIEYLDMTEAEEQGENELPWFETAQKEGN